MKISGTLQDKRYIEEQIRQAEAFIAINEDDDDPHIQAEVERQRRRLEGLLTRLTF